MGGEGLGCGWGYKGGFYEVGITQYLGRCLSVTEVLFFLPRMIKRST